ncbi:SapC family protein [Sphingomonas quercus]|uniref:SapC family protein n=1 Tax=Sphingomonas quercus TaxID=2842451 RepID=A0ABS6BGG0_9SPHN|nr:SapC family protein [Sphingomonas quercus]MBU3077378.1 SapC family protein [Sphingomonas quercus]
MARIELLDTVAHRDLRIVTRRDPSLGDRRNFVQLVASEFARAAAHYPIFFTKSAETGSFLAGAVLGFHDGENLFLDQGTSPYRPLTLRREPFHIVGDDLGFDTGHPRVSRAEGEPVFDADGQPSDYLRGVQQALTQLRYGLDETDAFIRRMLDHKLVEPIDISLRFDDGEHCRLDGLYTIARDGLYELSDADAVKLFRSGDLQLAFTMIGSLSQIGVMAARRNERLLDPV